MSFFDSLKRMLSSVFGLAEGHTERAADRMVANGPDSIRAQFRKTRGDWTRDYQQMRESVADLIRIREMRIEEVKRLTAEGENLDQKMTGAIELYKKNPDERFRDAYRDLAGLGEQGQGRIKELMAEIEEQQKTIERYKNRLLELQGQIENLSKEEAETVADIVSGQKIRELNDRLSGLTTDSQSQNLEAIRAARQKAKAVAKLSSELSGSDQKDFDLALKNAGTGAKHLTEFDSAVGRTPKASATADVRGELPGAPVDPVAQDLKKLLDGVGTKK